jgi:hypothetical protein
MVDNRDMEDMNEEYIFPNIKTKFQKEMEELEIKGIIEKVHANQKILTYLCGPIGVVPMKGCSEWRDMLTEELKPMNIGVINPLGQFGGDRLTVDRTKLKKSISDGDLEWIKDFMSKTVIPPDLQGIVDCTFVTVYIPKRINDDFDFSYIKKLKQEQAKKYIESKVYEICGTYGEVTLAFFLNKPVYIVTDRPLEPCEIPAWIVGCSVYEFSTFNQYLRFIKAVYMDKII